MSYTTPMHASDNELTEGPKKSYREHKHGRNSGVSKVTAFVLILIFCGVGFYLGQTMGEETGYSNGYNDGFASGQVEGETTGYDTGYFEGKNYGWNIGYTYGSEAGYETGYDEGTEQGYLTGFEEGESSGYYLGYETGFSEGFETTGWLIRNPTFSEMRNFLREDKTDRLQYQEIYFDCDDFAATLKQNAFDHGYMCYLVYMEFTKGNGHAIVAFETSDMGLKFVEPQSDKIMEVEIGEHYWDHPVSYDDTVTTLTLVP